MSSLDSSKKLPYKSKVFILSVTLIFVICLKAIIFTVEAPVLRRKAFGHSDDDDIVLFNILSFFFVRFGRIVSTGRL